MSNVERLLNYGPKDIVNTYSIVAALNSDLKGKRFAQPCSLAAELGGKSFKSKLDLPSPTATSVDSIASADTAPEPVVIETKKARTNTVKTRKPSLTRLKEKAREWSESELAQGFVDENGQEVWIVEDVLAYSATKGYRVKWVGWPETTWNLPKDMPRNDVWLNARMAKARYMHFCRK